MSASGPVAPGEGRGRLVDHQALRLGLLRGLSRFLSRAADPSAPRRCREHGQGHLGACAQGVRVHHALHRFTREDEWLEATRRQALVAVDAVVGGTGGARRGLAPDPDDTWETALAVDALAWLARGAPAVLGDDLERTLAAVTELARDGLVPALEASAASGLDGPGRLAAALGLGAAGRALERADWCDAARAAGDAALSGLSPEGLLLLDDDPGRLDARRQGLVPALWFALQQALRHEPTAAPVAEPRVVAALEALLALRDGTGRKPLELDARAPAGEAPYEVASQAFDAFALQAAAQGWPDHVAAPTWRVEAGRSLEEWVAHLNALDGGIDSHHGKGRAPGGCRLLWSAAGAWVARVVEDVALHAQPRAPHDRVLPGSGVVHLEGERWTALLRVRAAPGAAPRAGGSLISLVVRSDVRVAQGHECIAPPDRADEGQFTWVRRGALLGLGRGATFASHLDGAAEVERIEGGVRVTGGLADATGARLSGAVTERRFTGDAEGLALHDELVWTPAEGVGRGRLVYRLPRALRDVAVTCVGARQDRRGDRVQLEPGGGPLRLTISGRWGLDRPD